MTITERTPTRKLADADAEIQALRAELEQLRADIIKMNRLANAHARVQGYCGTWEQIIEDINNRTGFRLKLRGRRGHGGY